MPSAKKPKPKKPEVEVPTILCPHCHFPIPVLGQGAKMVVKVPGRTIAKLPKALVDAQGEPPPPKDKGPTPNEILGGLADSYWKLAKLFPPYKNFEVRESARLYVRVVRECGISPGVLQARTENYVRFTEDPKFLKRLSVWLELQATLPPDTEGTPDEPGYPENRLHARRRAE